MSATIQTTTAQLDKDKIITAIGKGDITAIQTLARASNGAALVKQTKKGITPIEIAMKDGSDEVHTEISKLEKEFFPPNIYNKKTWDELASCSFGEFKTLVTKLKINPNYRNNIYDEYGIEALIFRVSWTSVPDYQQKVSFLLKEHNANVNLKNKTDYRNTLLAVYIINEQHVAATDFLKLIITGKSKEFFNPNITDSNLRTPLMLAIAVGGFEDLIVLYLKIRNSNVLSLDLQDKDGFSALHIACITRQLRIITLLIASGASVELKDNQGRTPFELLDIKHVDEYKTLMDSVEIDPKRDKKAQYNKLLVSEQGIKNAFPIFTLENIQAMARKFLNLNGELTPETLKKLAAKIQTLTTKQLQKYYLKAVSLRGAPNWQKLYYRLRNSDLYSLDKPIVRNQRKEAEEMLNAMSGETLEQYALAPTRTETAQRIFSPDSLFDLQPRIRAKPLLITYAFNGDHAGIADLICAYIPPKDINQLFQKPDTSKSKKNKKK